MRAHVSALKPSDKKMNWIGDIRTTYKVQQQVKVELMKRRIMQFFLFLFQHSWIVFFCGVVLGCLNEYIIIIKR